MIGIGLGRRSPAVAVMGKSYRIAAPVDKIGARWHVSRSFVKPRRAPGSPT